MSIAAGKLAGERSRKVVTVQSGVGAQHSGDARRVLAIEVNVHDATFATAWGKRTRHGPSAVDRSPKPRHRVKMAAKLALNRHTPVHNVDNGRSMRAQ